MNNKDLNLKEKFKIALSSTAKVISDDFIPKTKSSENKKSNDLNVIEINDLKNPSDFIKLRAETDSSALKKNFLIMQYIKKIYQTIHHQDHFTI